MCRQRSSATLNNGSPCLLGNWGVGRGLYHRRRGQRHINHPRHPPPGIRIPTESSLVLKRPSGRAALIVVASALVLVAAGTTGAAAQRLITGSDIADASVSGRDIKNGSLSGSDVRDGSITVSDLATKPAGIPGSQGPADRPGPPGPPGLPGLPGLQARRANVDRLDQQATHHLTSTSRGRSSTRRATPSTRTANISRSRLTKSSPGRRC